jgi:hypothetical protein
MGRTKAGHCRDITEVQWPHGHLRGAAEERAAIGREGLHD